MFSAIDTATRTIRTIRMGAVAGPLAVAFVLGAGCNDDPVATCAKVLCDPLTFVADCDGHEIRRCDASGKRYSYEACGSQQRCDASAGAATCVARACTQIGVATCLSPTQLQRCRDDGSAQETSDCAAGDACRDGACVPTDCIGSENTCTTNGFLHCAPPAWVATACDPGEVCVSSAAGVRCAAPLCTPESRRCDGDASVVCDARGTTETRTTCAKTESCVSGRCVPSVCGEEALPADVSGGDGVGGGDEVDGVGSTGDTPETTTVTAQIKLTLDGQLTVFEQNAKASYDPGPKEVTIQAAKSTRELVIHLVPLDPTKLVTFDSAVFNPTHVYICYKDGVSDGGFLDCGAGFSHMADAWVLAITGNDGPGVGGRLQGTFHATLRDKNTLPLAVEGGSFDVPYR